MSRLLDDVREGPERRKSMASRTGTGIGFGRVVALVLGSLLIIPAVGLLIGGAALLLAYSFGRNGDGYFEASLDRVESPSAAVTAEDIDLMVDPGSPGWLVDQLDADVRLAVTSRSGSDNIFVGIGPEAQVDAYLSTVAHDELTDVVDGRPVYRNRAGTGEARPPVDQDFWVSSASGPGTQRLDWTTTSGRWAVVVMNADGSNGISTDVKAGVKADFVLPLAATLLGLGVVLTIGSVALIIAGAVGGGRQAPASAPLTGPAPAGASPAVAGLTAIDAAPGSPVALVAELDPQLSRGLWLVKWLLAIPHFIVLIFLWVAFAVMTVVAGLSILFRGVYPRGIFEFNLGVLRWSWRVSYYASSGGLGTDRYPPFSLGPEPDYPARLDVAYPERLSRGLVLVKWWLLAIPHYLIVAVLLGGPNGSIGSDQAGVNNSRGGPGLLVLLVLVAAVILLFSRRYPKALFDLIIGFNRWVYRVVAYAALMTDAYPPFRLDQGGTEPSVGPGVEPNVEEPGVEPGGEPIPAVPHQ